MSKNIQIPAELWQDLWNYHVKGETSQETSERILEALQTKAQAMRRRGFYTLALQGIEGAREAYEDETKPPHFTVYARYSDESMGYESETHRTREDAERAAAWWRSHDDIEEVSIEES